MKVVLASSSPRRRQLLEMVGLSPEIRCPDIAEDMQAGESVAGFLERITLAKLEGVGGQIENDTLVISADTIVLLDLKIIGKPANRDQARLILKSLSNRSHEVWTGVSLRYEKVNRFDICRTTVYFDNIGDKEIDYYLNCENVLDKAGAYGIQGPVSLFIKQIEGCYFNVMGFPLNLFFNMLKDMQLDSFLIRAEWKHEEKQ